MINPRGTVTQRVKITQRVTISQVIMVRLSEPNGFLVTEPRGLIIGTLGSFVAKTPYEWYICVIAQARGRFMTF